MNKFFLLSLTLGLAVLTAPIAEAGCLSKLFGGKNACCEAAPSCCEAVVCCEPAPVVCCEPAPVVCCEPAPVVCCEPAPAPCCEPAPCCTKRVGLLQKIRAARQARKCCVPTCDPCAVVCCQ